MIHGLETQKDGLRLTITQDNAPESPREWDNLGFMVCWHNRYVLGDKHNYQVSSQFLKEFDGEDDLILSLYLYDHSGITMSTQPFNCPWDSGQVGYIVASAKKIKEYFEVDVITEEVKKRAYDALRQEVKTYDMYLTGDVWQFIIERVTKCPTCGDEHTEVLESCGGIYGLDEAKEHIKEMPEYAFLLDAEEVKA